MSAEYKLSFHPQVDKDTKGADTKTRKRIKAQLIKIKTNPSSAKRLTGQAAPMYSHRFGTPTGEYRIAFIINDPDIYVLAILPRENFYSILKRRLG